MKYNKDIEEVRRLLERFYSGETTLEEEKCLERFFLERDAADIPEDMAVDRELFVGLSAMGPLPCELEMPEVLLGKIEDICESRQSRGGRRANEIKDRIAQEQRNGEKGHPDSRRFSQKRHRCENVSTSSLWAGHKWIVRAAGIAAACVVCAMVVVIARLTDKIFEPDAFLAAGASVDKVQDACVLTIVKSDSHRLYKEDDMPMKPVVRPPERSVDSRSKETEVADDDGFIEVTDPEEVRRIAFGIGKLLAQNADATKSAMAEISETFDNYKEITQNLLQ